MEAASTFGAQAASARRPVVIGADRWHVATKLAELWQYRELFYFLIWRDVKVRYAQSILGIGWAVIQPLVPMIIFTIVFGRVAQISSDGIPYALFAYTALVPWTYYSNALTDSSGSLVKEVNMLSKIYFPRLIIPLTSVLGKLIDLAISLGLLVALLIWYRTVPSPWVVIVVPLLTLLTMMAASGLGMLLSALALQYRDVKYGVPFAVQFLMYAAPVVYPASLIPPSVRYVYAVNPMVGVIEGFRASVVGAPLPWDLIAIAFVSATATLCLGATYFVRKEPVFADVA
jgi:homopolymeric O-antigen transport system permease protein